MYINILYEIHNFARPPQIHRQASVRLRAEEPGSQPCQPVGQQVPLFSGTAMVNHFLFHIRLKKVTNDHSYNHSGS